MARKRYAFDEKKIKRFIREGRGTGTGKHYKPWLTVSDFPSLGRVHRVFCPKTEREHHLLSDNEYYAFLLQWWDDNVIDIMEQFPLIDRRETLEIAARCGVRHPADPASGALWVITTDLLLTVHTGSGTTTVAYAVKQVEDLSKERTLEKLEIERRYWERREVPWSILTDRQVKCMFTRNLAWVLDPRHFPLKNTYSIELDTAIQRELASVQQIQSQMPIRKFCSLIDRKLGYKPATTLGVLRRLLGAKAIHVDLHTRSLHDLSVSAFSLQGGKE